MQLCQRGMQLLIPLADMSPPNGIGISCPSASSSYQAVDLKGRTIITQPRACPRDGQDDRRALEAVQTGREHVYCILDARVCFSSGAWQSDRR